MEQHPVPQNVTTFQFRLVGDMTIKQFGYLAGGVILAYVSYKLPLPFFFTWPLTAISALGGFCLAFVPVQERPMDVWITSFFKNVYNPTQYVWQKKAPTATVASRPLTHTQTEGNPVNTPTVAHAGASQKQSIFSLLSRLFFKIPFLHTDTQTPPTTSTQSMGMATQAKTIEKIFTKQEDASQKQPIHHRYAPASTIRSTSLVPDLLNKIRYALSLDWVIIKPKTQLNNKLNEQFQPIATEPASAPPSPTPQSVSTAAQTIPLPTVNKATVEENISTIEASLHAQRPVTSAATPSALHPEHIQLQGQVSELMTDRKRLEDELEALKLQMHQEKKVRPSVTPMDMSKNPHTAAQPTVRIIQPEGAVKAGLPKLTTFPNIVTGILKDPLGNLLSGILITIQDKEGVPLRALKSNKLGQFAASTPLINGDYVVEIEDPRGIQTFDRIKINLNGSVMSPLEIHAKSQKQISRDKLAKEIFGETKL